MGNIFFHRIKQNNLEIHNEIYKLRTSAITFLISQQVSKCHIGVLNITTGLSFRCVVFIYNHPYSCNFFAFVLSMYTGKYRTCKNMFFMFLKFNFCFFSFNCNTNC